MSETTPPQPPQPAFDPAAPHQQRPKLRHIRLFPAKVGDQTLMGVADARQISDRMVVTAPAVQAILPLMNGEKTVDEIVAEIGRGLTRQNMEMLVAQLDDAALLFGPKFDGLLTKMRADFDATTNLPPASTAAFADAVVAQALQREATDAEKSEQGPRRLRELMDQWIAKALENAESPSFDELPRAVIAPHIDYPRGWLNYAGVWGRMRVVDRPDRVIILGTNHFGMATGVCACDKGYETPLGLSPLATEVASALRSRLGDVLFEHRYDHEHEHSVELQIPWIQHCLGPGEGGQHCPVMGVLVHDPAPNNGASYDGKGVALLPFVEALRAVIDGLPGRTLIVASADLSHAGPMFGDQTPLVGDGEAPEKFRNKVMQHDREMLELVLQNKPDELVASMAWQQNPTRWCSTGNIVAALLTVRPQRVQVLNYVAAADQQGAGMVSHVAAAMW